MQDSHYSEVKDLGIDASERNRVMDMVQLMVTRQKKR